MSTPVAPEDSHLSSSESPSPSTLRTFEVAVVGGGAGGLAASIALARSLRSVVVIDAGQPRNVSSAHAHNVLGQEGINPHDLIAKGRAEAQAYGVTFIDDTAATVRTSDNDPRPAEAAPASRFELTTSAGVNVRSQRIILATGLTDELPDIPGLADGWGETVLHCPYCHGFEVRGQRIGIIGTTAMSYHQAMLFSQLSNRVTFIRHVAPAPDAEQSKMLSSLGIEFVDASLAEVARTNDETVVTVEADTTVAVGAKTIGTETESAEMIVDVDAETPTSGSARTLAFDALAPASESDRTITFDALAVGGFARANTELFTQLGGTVVDHPSGMGTMIPTQMAGQTDVPGVWAVGNSADMSAMVVASMASGVMAGAHVNADLIMESIG